MALNLVTGYRGRDHVTAEQWADFNRGIYGESAILPVGNKMAVTIQTANQITVKDGVAVFDGREVYIGYGESENITIQSGTQGTMRNDIVVVKYTRDEETGVEDVSFEVVSGTPVSSNPQDPVYQNTDIRTGVFTSQKPFCRVRINGTAIESVVMLVSVKEFQNVAFSGSYNDLKDKPTSMKANGGNADTVDGKHATDLQNYNNLTNKPDLGTAASQNVANNLTTNTAGSVLDARQGKTLDEKITELKNNVIDLNSKQLTNSTYYPTSYMYRSGQNVYLRCSGTTTKEVPQGTELVVATEGTVPESFCPDIDLIFYTVVSPGGAIVRVSISTSGKVTFTAQEKLVEGFGINLHVNYITGKNPL